MNSRYLYLSSSRLARVTADVAVDVAARCPCAKTLHAHGLKVHNNGVVLEVQGLLGLGLTAVLARAELTNLAGQALTASLKQLVQEFTQNFTLPQQDSRLASAHLGLLLSRKRS